MPIFQILETMFCWIENLKMSVRVLMATRPRCFRCMYETPSGPTADVGLFRSISCLFMFGVEVHCEALLFVNVVVWESGKEA